MTCSVVGCEKPDVAKYKVRIKTDSGELKDGDVSVCTEHEKAFEVIKNQKSKERFVN